MSDTSLNKIVQYGTSTDRVAFTPDPAAGSQVLYLWYETDNAPDTYAWDGSAWVQINPGGSGPGGSSGDLQYNNSGSFGGITPGTGVSTALAQNVTGSGGIVLATSPTLVTPALGTPSALVLTHATGLVTAGINASQVTLAKIQNAAASSKLLGSGASGSGSAYTEVSLGTNLSMSGTTLNATGGGAWTLITKTVTSGSPSSITFSAISGSYNNLKILWQAQDTGAGTVFVGVRLSFNGDTTAGNYTGSARVASNNASSVVSDVAASSLGVFIGWAMQSGDTHYTGVGEISIPNYSATTFYKTLYGASGGYGSSNRLDGQMAATWKNTAAITSITIASEGTAWADGSTFILYGIT